MPRQSFVICVSFLPALFYEVTAAGVADDRGRCGACGIGLFGCGGLSGRCLSVIGMRCGGGITIHAGTAQIIVYWCQPFGWHYLFHRYCSSFLLGRAAAERRFFCGGIFLGRSRARATVLHFPRVTIGRNQTHGSNVVAAERESGVACKAAACCDRSAPLWAARPHYLVRCFRPSDKVHLCPMRPFGSASPAQDIKTLSYVRATGMRVHTGPPFRSAGFTIDI